MVAVIGPSLPRSEEVLESDDAECYNRTVSRGLDRALLPGLREMFVRWLTREVS
jgi:hypothetical protein